MRFWRGRPQTIGGWNAVTSDTLAGKCRGLISWADSAVDLTLSLPQEYRTGRGISRLQAMFQKVRLPAGFDFPEPRLRKLVTARGVFDQAGAALLWNVADAVGLLGPALIGRG